MLTPNELIIVLVVVVLLIGAQKVPNMIRQMIDQFNDWHGGGPKAA